MQLTFSTAKNGSLTCKFDDMSMHSLYNPERESETFVKNLDCTFLPKAIIIIEPALSYCVDFLRKQFPYSILCAIRFACKVNFSDYDSNWDKIFCVKNDSQSECQKISEDIFNFLGEEKLCAAYTTAWPAAAKIFPKETQIAWQAIKIATEKASSVLYTRGYFSKRWFLNSVKNFLFCKNLFSFSAAHKIEVPVVIAASGPSLKTTLPYLQKNRSKFFLIAVSSALTALRRHEIVPDLCLATDGGYWAKRHFDFANKIDAGNKKNYFAFPLDACLPASICAFAKIVPLCYANSFANDFLSESGIKFFPADENGTVSGTALMLAEKITKSDIFFCGLDLASAPGTQHTEPNALEEMNSCSDCRTKTKETRITMSRFASDASLKIYREWFSNLPSELSARVYRIYCEKNFSSNLGAIKDISVAEFSEKIQSKKKDNLGEKYFQKQGFDLPIEKRQKIASQIVKAKINTPDWKKHFFPVESVSIERAMKIPEREKLKALLEDRNQKFAERLSALLNKNRGEA